MGAWTEACARLREVGIDTGAALLGHVQSDAQAPPGSSLRRAQAAVSNSVHKWGVVPPFRIASVL
eukprot:8038606-Alexandrium_andersonii.AAC.1